MYAQILNHGGFCALSAADCGATGKFDQVVEIIAPLKLCRLHDDLNNENDVGSYLTFDKGTTIEKVGEAVAKDQNSATESPENDKRQVQLMHFPIVPRII
jgi:hypothetical protein